MEKLECQDFKFMGIACITAIPVIFDVNTLCGLLISTLNYDFFQISLKFWHGFQDTSNPRKIYMHITGYPVQHGDSPYFL